ncbi:glycosyltransferase [Gimibacter soli]|uniref:Glycosyltransferase n=1 Tax=Gimibacter soli TaxID=3024400 RepID=A0AAE9XX34_9PROT|nr:glycosyltransferase [Gimibacter soli]WCL55119.1 glycosyltransferase [Gimibacter soli]
MRILFIHNNFPGQYRRIERYFQDDKSVDMRTVTLKANKQDIKLRQSRFEPHRAATKGIHPAVLTTEQAVLMGQAAYSAMLNHRKEGWQPDIILSHAGWGSGMFAKDAFPDAKQLSYFEWFYHAHGSDFEYMRGNEGIDANDELRLRMKNTPLLTELASMDWGQCPTAFQLSQLPTVFHSRITQLHDGVDTDYFAPDAKAVLQVGKLRLTADDEVITYVARGMEEYRGFPQFMEMVSMLQKRRPNLQVVLLGDDRVAYGAKRKDGKTFKQWALETFELDLSRIHFLGLQPLGIFRTLMQISKAHVYLTAPFVLSWSMLEAMSTGALIVGSETAPVQEVITHGQNGLLVPFRDPAAQAAAIEEVLNRQKDFAPLREAARQTILERYDTRQLLPKYAQLIQSVANGSQFQGAAQ